MSSGPAHHLCTELGRAIPIEGENPSSSWVPKSSEAAHGCASVSSRLLQWVGVGRGLPRLPGLSGRATRDEVILTRTIIMLPGYVLHVVSLGFCTLSAT